MKEEIVKTEVKEVKDKKMTNQEIAVAPVAVPVGRSKRAASINAA